MKISKKLLSIFFIIVIGSIATSFILACSSTNVVTPPIEEPILPPSNTNVTTVKTDSTNLGHVVPNPNINGTNKDNAFLIADSQFVPYNNEGNGPILPLQQDYIANSKYLNMSKRSYSIIFNQNNSYKMGTAWILDYQLTNDTSYPTTWYFATNAHVANNLKVKNDYNNHSKYNYNQVNENTTEVVLVGAKDISQNSAPQLGGKVGDLYQYDTAGGSNVAKLKIKTGTGNDHSSYSDNPIVKTIFSGLDYLDSKPSDFNKSDSWKDIEEFIDFAVLEIKFSSETIAKTITNDYANWNEAEKFKLPTSSLLHDDINRDSNNHYVLGFPGQQNSHISNLTINKINATPSIISEGGTKLANTKIFSTFEDLKYMNKGIMDATLGMPWFKFPFLNGQTDSINNLEPKSSSYQVWGLSYILQNANLMPGASGSMVMNSDFESIGIQFAIDQSADYGISFSLVSEGYNYKGKYGWYNLPSYDLINGGKIGQKNSYKQSLAEIYSSKPKIRTHIFPNGF